MRGLDKQTSSKSSFGDATIGSKINSSHSLENCERKFIALLYSQ